MKLTYIERFIRDECSNYDKHDQICISDKPCKALNGQRCGFFERAVLGPPDYKCRLPDYDYQKLFAQYAELIGEESQDAQQRRCDCGAPLRHRQRYCRKCSKKRAKEANRERQRKHRLSKCINVTV
jgi:hypothetical protein